MPRTIADLTPGDLIYLDETVSGETVHTPYIHLGLDEYGKARILRKYAAISKRMNATNVASYNGCEADLWLEDESAGFLSRFDAATINALDYTTIAYVDYNQGEGGNTAQVLTIARRCFPLSYTEEGWAATAAGAEGTSFLPALKAHYGTTNDNTARIGRSANETTVYVWMRSANSASQFRYVYANGSASSNNASNGNYWLRPALSVAPATSVSDEGADAIFLLPDGRTTTWGIEASVSLGKTEQRPKRCKLLLPHDEMQTLDVQVCNNYGDAAPTWISCADGGVATFGDAKTAESWELGVRIVAASSLPGRTVGEPAMIVEFEEEAEE